nr:hypothetical protein [Tanacetum cinerariifolium]
MMVLGIPVMSACVYAKMSALALSKFRNSFLKCSVGYPFFVDGKGPSGLLCFLPSFANREYSSDSFFASMITGASTGAVLLSFLPSPRGYLEVSRDRLLPNILGGGLKLFVTLSVARISLGLLDRLESNPWFGPR